MDNLIITAVNFSIKDEITDNDSVVYYVDGHVSFKYVLGGVEYAGSIIHRFLDIGVVYYDGAGHAEGYETLVDSLPTREDVYDWASEVAWYEYQSIVIKQLSDTVGKATCALCDKLLGYDSDINYSLLTVNYPELEKWTTGIGSNKINESDPSGGDPSTWEYPQQFGDTLKITQAYLAQLNGTYLNIQ